MKYIIPILILSVFPLLSVAQSDSTTIEGHLEIAPVLLCGASMFMGTAPEGSETRPSLAFTVGVMSAIHISNTFAILGAVAYESRSVYFQAQGEPALNQRIRMNYVAIPIGFKWREFFLLTVMGLPVSSRQELEPDSWYYTSEQSPDPIIEFHSGPREFSSDDMLLDLRIGGIIPLMEFNRNHLDLQIQASYSLSYLVREGFHVAQSFDPSERVMKSPIATFQFGLAYFFSLR